MTSHRRGFTAAVLGLAVLAASVYVAAAPPATAVQTDPGRCVGATVGHRLPVLFVHGFTSSSSAWDTDRQALSSDPNVCVDAFNYGRRSDHPDDQDYSTQWVTDPHLGQALADRLLAMSAASKAAGGQGKIVVIGHSLGGLVLRCATDSSCSHGHGGVDVEHVVRAAITFDTPHQGTELKAFGASWAANGLGAVFSVGCPVVKTAPTLDIELAAACHFLDKYVSTPAAKAFTPGSAQLETLGKMPQGFPEMAVAGQIAVTTSLFGRFTTTLGHVGDLVVSADSAQAFGYVRNGIGGKTTIDCGSVDLATLGLSVAVSPITHRISNMTCWHGSETSDPKFLGVVKKVLGQVESADHIVTQTPLDTVDATGYNPDATYHVTIWARDESVNCALFATSATIADYMTSHYCKQVHRVLASTNVGGHPVAMSIAYASFGNPPGPDPVPPDIPSYEYAAGFGRLISQDGTGTIRSLLADGKTIPGNTSADVPSPDAFDSEWEDSGGAIFDLWYLDRPTPVNDPALVSTARASFLLVY